MRNQTRPELSRAEQVRQRRSLDSKEKLKAYKNKKTESTFTPGVTVRDRSIGIPVHMRTKNRLRRKYTLTLGNGVEMLLPAIPVFRPGWRLLSTPLFILMGALLYSMLNMPEFQVTRAVVYGADRINPIDIQSITEVNDVPIFLIDPKEIEDRLSSAYPELTGVSVEIGLPALVAIHIEEKNPLLSWSYSSTTLWIDESGSIFPPRGEADLLFDVNSDTPPPLKISDSSELFVFSVEDGEQTGFIGKSIDPNVLEAAVKLRQAIPDIRSIVYDKKDGFGWVDSKGWRVFIGISMNDIDQKLLMYQKITQYLDKENIQPSMISVAQVHAPYYRMD